MNFHGGDIYRLNKEILDFSSNINPLGIPGSFKRLLGEKLEDFTKYPDIEYQDIKQKIAAYMKVKDNTYIIPGNGAVELVYKLTASSGAERVVSLKPTFSEYSRAAKVAGLGFKDIAAFNMDFSAVDTDLLRREIKPHTLVIICNPNNPTGTLVGKAEMMKLAADLQAQDCKLIIDEAFIEFTDDYPENSMVDVLDEFMNVTVIRAATKFFGMPGIRLGYAVTGNIAVAKQINELMEPWNVNSAAVIAACCIYEDNNYIDNTRSWIKNERKHLYEELCNFKELRVYPSKANFHMVELISRKMTAAQLKENMAENGVLIRTAEGFNGLSEFFLRLAVKDRSSNEMLIKTMREFLE